MKENFWISKIIREHLETINNPRGNYKYLYFAFIPFLAIIFSVIK